MKNSLALLVLAAAIALASVAGGAALVSAQTGGGYDLTWNTIDGGGTTSTGGGYGVSGTMGQPDAGTMSGGSYQVTGGFWAGAGLRYTAYLPVVTRH